MAIDNLQAAQQLGERYELLEKIADGEMGSDSAFRLSPKLRLGVPSSSSESKVRSITCVPGNPLIGDRSGRDGDNSLLTSSSSSESKTTTSPDFWLLPWVKASPI